MTKEPISGLHPLNECVLVELQQSLRNVAVKEGKFDTRTEGIVIAVDETSTEFRDMQTFIGKRVFFEEYKEGSRIKRDGKVYSFIKFEDIRGYEDVETS